MNKTNVKNGTIGRFTLTWGDKTHQKEVVGVALYTPETSSDNRYYFLDMSGKYHLCNENDLLDVKAVRIGTETRTSLTTIAKQYEDMMWMKAQLRTLQASLNKTESNFKSAVNSFVNEYTNAQGLYTDKQVNEMFAAKGLDITSYGKQGDVISVEICDQNSGERYSKNDMPYPFMYMEYDGNVFVERDRAPKAYDQYADQYAPKTNNKLADICKKMGGACKKVVSAGDKYLYATTKYVLYFQKGYRRDEVDAVLATI